MSCPAAPDVTPSLPPTPGTYMLLLQLETPLQLSVGRLGDVRLGAGLYAYVGSARGPGGLRARAQRHLRAAKRPHWHIDALTARVSIAAVWWVESSERLECAWARMLAALPGVHELIAGFGASDCTCRSHLLCLPAAQLGTAWEALGQPLRIALK